MAHKKAGGSSRNGRDSESKRLGIKKFGDQAVSSRQYSGSPARHEISRRRKCRPRPRSHFIRQGRRPGKIRAQRAEKAGICECRVTPGSRIFF